MLAVCNFDPKKEHIGLSSLWIVQKMHSNRSSSSDKVFPRLWPKEKPTEEI